MNSRFDSAALSARFASFTDEELVVETRNFRTVAAFDELIRRYRPALARYLRSRYNLTSEQLDDALQGAFLRAWKHLDEFDVERRFHPWIYRIATTQAVDQLRSANRHNACVSLDAPQNGEETSLASVVKDERLTPDDAAEQNELASEVRRAAADLPEQYRDVVELVYYRGMTCTNAAKALNVAAATVSRRVNKALELLAAAIDAPRRPVPAC